jgi:hypothetical protein
MFGNFYFSVSFYLSNQNRTSMFMKLNQGIKFSKYFQVILHVHMSMKILIFNLK